MPGSEAELRYVPVPCHTQLPEYQVTDVTPKDVFLMPHCPAWQDVPLERIIRLINNLINDLSSFSKGLMM